MTDKCKHEGEWGEALCPTPDGFALMIWCMKCEYQPHTIVSILNSHASLTEKAERLEKENAIRKVWLEELSQVNLKWAKEIARHNALNEKKTAGGEGGQ